MHKTLAPRPLHMKPSKQAIEQIKAPNETSYFMDVIVDGFESEFRNLERAINQKINQQTVDIYFAIFYKGARFLKDYKNLPKPEAQA